MTTSSHAPVADLMSTMAGLAKQLHHAFASQPSPVPGVETAQLVLLTKLGHESLSVGRLAELVHSDTSTVSRHVNRLAEKGLVAKAPADHDRRMQVLTLTAEGEAARRQMIADRTRVFEAFLVDFDGDDVARLCELLGRFAVGVSRHLDTHP